MQVVPRVLLLHSNSEWNEVLSRALGGAQVVSTASPQEALTELAGRRADLIVAEDRVDVAFLEELSKRAPATPRAILLNGSDRKPWLEAAAEGHRFAAIPEAAPDLAERLQTLLRGQAEATGDLAGCTADVVAQAGRVRVTGPVLRIGSESLQFRLEPGESLASFLPGSELDEVAVYRGRELLLGGCAASVRSLAPDHAGGFEVDVTLGAVPARALPEEVIRDPMQRSSLVSEALRRGRLRVEGVEGHPSPAVVRGRVDPLVDAILIQPPPGFPSGSAARFFFDAGGTHYRFVSSLTEPLAPAPRPSLVVALPRELRGRRRRRPRALLDPAVARVEIPAFLAGGTLTRPALDVDLEGMGVLAQPDDLLPLGARLADLRVSLGDGVTIRASGRVASRAATAGPRGPAVRCGVQFEPLAPEERAALASTILRQTHPGLELGRGLTFDALWSFLKETGFLYPEKEAKLRTVLPQLHRTLGTLLARPDGPLRTLLFRADGLLAGHLSMARAYRRTWMVQHLAVTKEGPGKLDAARALNVGVVDYLEQLSDCEWARIWYRPDNRWPARTFGRFARLQYDPHRCDLRTYAYLVADPRRAPTPGARDLEIQPARPADWAEIRGQLVARGQTSALSAEDLCSAPELTEVGEAFRALGLERRREALVARRRGRLAAFALLEISSVGLNFSELTNAFRLHALDPDPAVTGALAAAARDRYAGLGRNAVIGLAENPDLPAWRAAGFEQVKSYSCWTVHRSVMRRYVEFIQRLYECLPSRAIRPAS